MRHTKARTWWGTEKKDFTNFSVLCWGGWHEKFDLMRRKNVRNEIKPCSTLWPVVIKNGKQPKTPKSVGVKTSNLNANVFWNVVFSQKRKKCINVELRLEINVCTKIRTWKVESFFEWS